VGSANTAFPDSIPSLSDGVVRLRAPSAADSQAVAGPGTDAEGRRWINVPEPFTRSDAEAWRRRIEAGWAAGTLYQFVVEADGELAGLLNLRPGGGGVAEVGYMLAPSKRGRGLIARALRLALRWGFDEAGLEVVHWKAQVDNWPSRRAGWAVGFRVQEEPVAGLMTRGGRAADGWLATLRKGDALQPAHRWLVPEPLSGPSVALRPHREPDVARIVEAGRDPETARWLSRGPDGPARQHLDRILGEQAAGKAVHWAVADPGDDRMLAELRLSVPDPTQPIGEITYWCHPEARGRGVTTEAVRLAARHGLRPVEDGGLGLVRLLLRASVHDPAAQRVAEKAGFTRSGTDRGAWPGPDGGWEDGARFDLLAGELPAVG
jgi:RimJ/RimL family protein N-acetyltransferase